MSIRPTGVNQASGIHETVLTNLYSRILDTKVGKLFARIFGISLNKETQTHALNKGIETSGGEKAPGLDPNNARLTARPTSHVSSAAITHQPDPYERFTNVESRINSKLIYLRDLTEPGKRSSPLEQKVLDQEAAILESLETDLKELEEEEFKKDPDLGKINTTSHHQTLQKCRECLKMDTAKAPEAPSAPSPQKAAAPAAAPQAAKPPPTSGSIAGIFKQYSDYRHTPSFFSKSDLQEMKRQLKVIEPQVEAMRRQTPRPPPAAFKEAFGVYYLQFQEVLLFCDMRLDQINRFSGG